MKRLRAVDFSHRLPTCVCHKECVHVCVCFGVMYSTYQDRQELEDELYQEDEGDSDASEANSELEFHLYSQLHYSSNAGEVEEQEDRGEEAQGQDSQRLEVTERTTDVDGEQEHTGESRPTSPDISKLLQDLRARKKGEKRDKQKKEKSSLKGQRSSFFEEVIVIDSGPDVISISEGDTADEDESICALKARDLPQMQTSTPAHEGSQKRKRDLSGPVMVDSSSSKSDSEESESDSSGSSESSDSSDSECLENWMILGPGNQDGDRSISLNLEGGSDSDADGGEEEGRTSWVVSDKDKEAQIYNKDKGARITVQRMSNRYYTDKSVQCRNCNRHGHLSKNCPEPKKLSPCFLCGTPGHMVSHCPYKHCNNCGLPGHLYESCSERAYWHKQCHRCSMTGHFFDDCPEIWRQYHITTKAGLPVMQEGEDHGRSPAYCYNCSRKGHFGHACTQRRMFNGTYPSTPFINHYDTVDDINRRQNRIRMKVKDLKKNGFFLAGPGTPLTPGPPEKKQKVNNHNTPQQSTNNHKPGRGNHIFFNDNHDFNAPTPKKNKYNKYKPESTGSVKPWKPKRPVPNSRDPPARIILDEADDFPRGGSKAAGIDMKKKKKRKKERTQKIKPVSSETPNGRRRGRPDHLFGNGQTPGSDSKPEKAKRRKRNRAQRVADKKLAGQMYPTDENLFIIKQRKRKSR
ncbi:zinc finger CCHC domain-containing protein 7 isoform X1 [Larimichthys crocea]|uniref:zinc finger CCHC domain-containing protein 7 isoform X1 n=2 Tax=Larimichthys crocea TaxID=215358 RepID=UPI000F5E8188|nr:zinc finger CCHC domain-containing protein 7 isoform X1 [Larimichthys crocea]